MSKLHLLHDIDLEKQTALCAVCGQTQIHISGGRAGGAVKIRCITRARDSWLKRKDQDRRARIARRARPDPNPSFHRLSEIDLEANRALCSICGVTDVWQTKRKGISYYTCGNKGREYIRNYKRTHSMKRASTLVSKTED